MQSLISEHDLDLTEDEYALLISVCAHGAPWARARAVLGSMSRELTGLQEGTLAAVQRYFRCTALQWRCGSTSTLLLLQYLIYRSISIYGSMLGRLV